MEGKKNTLKALWQSTGQTTRHGDIGKTHIKILSNLTQINKHAFSFPAIREARS